MQHFFFYGKVREDLSPPLKRVPYNSRRAKFEGDISLKLRIVGKIYRHWYGGDNFVTPTIKFNFVCKISQIWAISSLVFEESHSNLVFLPQGDTRDFKWLRWSKDFFGFEIFDPGIFVGTKIWLGYLDLSKDFLGVLKRIRWGEGYIQMVWWINKHECSISNVFLCVIALPLSGTFKGHKIGMGFFGGQFLVQGFFWVLLEALGIFLGLDFWLHSIIPVTWNPEYPPWDFY